MRLTRGKWTALAALVCSLPGAAVAQQPGDHVSSTRAIELKIRDRTTARAEPNDVLTVEKEKDDWLWVATPGGDHGWILKEDVRIVDIPAGPDDTRPPSGGNESAGGAELDADDRLRLIGAMGATQVYLTYAYIGSIGDGSVNKTYSPEKVQELMEEVSSMTKTLVDQLKRVRQGRLTDDDARTIDQMIEINSMLQRQAQALVKFSQNPTQDNGRAFDDIRTAVWPRISDLLGLKPPEDATPAESDSSEKGKSPKNR